VFDAIGVAQSPEHIAQFERLTEALARIEPANGITPDQFGGGEGVAHAPQSRTRGGAWQPASDIRVTCDAGILMLLEFSFQFVLRHFNGVVAGEWT
jgi:hypothetical protein